jgi:hypothetical protein
MSPDEKTASEEFRRRQFSRPHPAIIAGFGPSASLARDSARDCQRVVVHFDVDAFYAQSGKCPIQTTLCGCARLPSNDPMFSTNTTCRASQFVVYVWAQCQRQVCAGVLPKTHLLQNACPRIGKSWSKGCKYLSHDNDFLWDPQKKCGSPVCGHGLWGSPRSILLSHATIRHAQRGSRN